MSEDKREYIKLQYTVGNRPSENIKIFDPISNPAPGNKLLLGFRLCFQDDSGYQLYFDFEQESILCVETNRNGTIVGYSIYDKKEYPGIGEWTVLTLIEEIIDGQLDVGTEDWFAVYE